MDPKMEIPPPPRAGQELADLVYLLDASRGLRGAGSKNERAYYDHSGGLPDGVAACVETVRAKTDVIRFRTSGPYTPAAFYTTGLDGAIDHLRRAAACAKDDPDRLAYVQAALVEVTTALAALLWNAEGVDKLPDLPIE